MNALQLVNEYLSRFDLKEVASFSGTTGADDTIALRKINLAIQEICAAHPFKWLHKTSTGSIAAVNGTSTYSLASDVKQVIAAKHTYQDGGFLQVVDRATLEMYRPDRADSTQRGTPTHLCLFGKTQSGTNWLWQAELWPIPDSNFGGQTISYYYTIIPTDLSASTDVPMVPNDFHWLILDKAEMLGRRGPMRVGGDDRQIDFYSAAAQSYQQGIQRLIAQDSIYGTEEATWEEGRIRI